VRDITEILVHWQAGRSVSEISQSLGVDRKTVRKYVNIACSLGFRVGQVCFSSQEWSRILAHHCPEVSNPAARSEVFAEIARFHDAIVDGLQTNHASTVHQRLHDEKGMKASQRSFYRYLDQFVPDRPGRPQPTVLRDDPPPGQEAQLDFGYLGTWIDPSSGKRQRLWAFVMVLSFSRHMFVRIVTKMDQKAWVQAHVAAFTFFGSVVRLLIPDNLKTGVISPDLYDPKLNRGYEEMAVYYGTLIDPARSNHPKDKPRVERMIPYVRESYFAGRNFGSLEEMNQAADKWCLSVAGQRIHGTTHCRPLDLFQQVEAANLLPLPSQPFEAVTWARGTVHKDCHVRLLGSLYSIPHRHVGKVVDARASDKVVEFYLGHELIKTHRRVPKGRRQTDWNDYPPEKAAFYQRTPNWCQSQANLLGLHVAQAVEGLLAKHKLHYLRQCQGIIGLAKKYGAARLDAACQRALAFGDGSYKTIANILNKGLDGQVTLPTEGLGTVKANSTRAHLHGPQELFSNLNPNNTEEDPTNG
jgi:transposase